MRMGAEDPEREEVPEAPLPHPERIETQVYTELPGCPPPPKDSQFLGLDFCADAAEPGPSSLRCAS